MKKSPVLIINSYAGSLTIAAHQEGHQVIGSYEDGGYGLAIQRHNFPKIDCRDTVAEWLEQTLHGVIVIAHPPCAAFSQQNNSEAKRGTDAPKFQQTKYVIDYALRLGCAALAVESVPGACEGARSVHDELAGRYGYDVYRVQQNAATFGVPQWRERFWAIFLPHTFSLRFDRPTDTAARVRDAIGPFDAKDTYPELARMWAKQKERLMIAFGASQARELMNGKHGLGMLPSVLRRYLKTTRGVERTQLDVAREHCEKGYFMTNTIRFLDPAGLAPVILGTSCWGINGRPLAPIEYQRLMGFPDDYQFPTKEFKNHRFFLSRGVCPPVARWVLRTCQASVAGSRTAEAAEPGALVDLRPGSRMEFLRA